MQIIPDKDDYGQRLDRYLRKIFPGAKLGDIYGALRKKDIRVNGQRKEQNYRINAGDMIDIFLPGDREKIWRGSGKILPTKNHESKLDIQRILYEDEDIIIYDKPRGLIVHSPDHATDEISLIDQITDYLREKGWHPTGTFQKPALAHRIDRDTSGIIITCLNRQSYEHMAEQFRTRKVKKTYLALVTGCPTPLSGIISAPLMRLDTGRTDEAKMVVDPRGDQAETSYRTLKKYEGYSLVELSPKTGRTHQIRVHMAHIGCPLIGDRRYGGTSVIRFPTLSDLRGIRGHLLHAANISFIHPRGHSMDIACPISWTQDTSRV